MALSAFCNNKKVKLVQQSDKKCFKSSEKRSDYMLRCYPDILTPRDVMEILSISKNTLYRLIREERLPAFRLGRRSWRFRKDDIQFYLTNMVDEL